MLSHLVRPSRAAVGLAPGNHRAARFAAALPVLLALVPGAGFAQPQGQVSFTPGDPQARVAIIAGEPVTAEEITSFGLLLSATERRPDSTPAADLEEYILTRLHSDVYTTVPASDPGLASIPARYKIPAQRSLLQRAVRAKVEEGVEVTRPEMEQWYEKNIDKYIRPEAIEAHHLFMQISREEPTSAPERVRQRIGQVKREADEGTSFAMLARRYSEAASGAAGGYIGTVRQGRPFGPQGKPINPRLEEALFGLQPGEVSDVVQTTHGLHLLYAADRTTTVTPSLEDFISSGIVQRAVKADKVTSARQELLEETIRRHGGRIADLSTTAAADLTTATPAIEFAGKTLTVHDYEKIYGLPFTRAFTRARSNPEQLRDLYRQLLELEAEVQAAVDAGLDKRPDTARDLALLEKRAEATRHLQGVYAAAAPVPEEEQRAAYEKMKETLRRPEAEGWVITLEPGAPAADAAAAARMRAEVEQKAKEIRARLDAGEEFEKVVADVSSDDLVSTAGAVARHVVGEAGTSEAQRAFDIAIRQAKEEGDILGPVPFGDGFAVAKLEKRYPGEPVPFEMIQPRLARQLQSENQQKLREEILSQLEAGGKVRYLPGAASYGKSPAGGAADARTTAPAAAQQ